ncbi:transposase [Limosilactobacillus gastricus DSM 16045]|uniref:Transposase n=1 Tax=Limosilactobacillus gastricus DSM 16045 TaxID=1423749 RepID=A0A0R1VCP5_9LACO|nr:transposase [Limosilactobacillus gastricus DSM 16045]
MTNHEFVIRLFVPLVEKAKQNRHIDQPLIMHSDRGSQFTSEAYNQATAEMTLSYSKKSYPGDNACIESFHALIKRKWLNRFKIHSYSEAKRLVFQYIETFYNTVRTHSRCEFKSPKQFEDEYQTLIQNLTAA